MEKLELDDIQGIIARGYGNLHAACYVLLEVVDLDSAKTWLAALADNITTGQDRPEESALNVALTYTCLGKLKLPDETLAMFPDEFAGGMTTPHQQRVLGDVGENAPDNWRWGGPGNQTIDILLMIYSLDDERLAERYGSLSSSFVRSGLLEVKRLDTFDLNGREHFGFRDGISQPIIEGLSKQGTPANTIKAGEFILGYRNEYDLYMDSPLVKSEADAKGLLPIASTGSGEKDLGRNGSYLIIRQLRQDVQAFWEFMDKATMNSDGTSNPTTRTQIAAKMVGRWPSGAPSVKAPDQDDPKLADENDFGYHELDPHGFNCPIGAHVRRTNPRDSLEPRPGSDRSIAIGKRHRLLRRGREYGRPFTAETASEERGLHFICLNANIARQFGFVQHTWLNNPKFDGLYDDGDPIVGDCGLQGCTFTIQSKPVRRRLMNVPQFVRVQGGAYFFLPGIRAIRFLANTTG